MPRARVSLSERHAAERAAQRRTWRGFPLAPEGQRCDACGRAEGIGGFEGVRLVAMFHQLRPHTPRAFFSLSLCAGCYVSPASMRVALRRERDRRRAA